MEYFRAANGELFHTDLITKKPIGIQFFPGCVLWTKLAGSNLPDKDLLIRFNVLHTVKKLHITALRICYKQMFKPYTDSLNCSPSQALLLMILSNPVFFFIVQKVIVNFFILPLSRKMKTSSLTSLLSLTKTLTQLRLPIQE